MNRKIALIVLGLVLALTLIQVVYAQEQPNNEQVNLLDIPKHLAKAFGIPEYAGRLLASICLTMIIMLPILLWARNLYLMLIIGLSCLGFCCAIGWLDFWFMLIICLIVAGLWSGKMRGWLTGNG
jgi:type III secretory pathway component EscU